MFTNSDAAAAVAAIILFCVVVSTAWAVDPSAFSSSVSPDALFFLRSTPIGP
jgi:hypothetical protein